MSEMLLWLDVTSGYIWGVEMNIDRYRDCLGMEEDYIPLCKAKVARKGTIDQEIGHCADCCTL